MSSSPARKKSKAKAQNPSIRVHWGNTEDLETVFVDNLYFQVINDQVYLTFGEVRVPLDPDVTDVVEIRPMMRLITTPRAARKMVEVMSNSLKNLEKDMEKR